MSRKNHRSLRLALCGLAAALVLPACSGDEEKPRAKTDTAAVTARTKKWAFVDAFAALKDRDPARRLEAVEWIGAHLSVHSGLAKDALRAAAADEDQEVASRAKRYLRAMGDRR